MMGCLKIDTEYEGKIIKMARTNSTNNTQDNNEILEKLRVLEEKIDNNSKKGFFWELNSAKDWLEMLVIVVPVVLFFGGLGISVNQLTDKVEALSTEVASISDYIENDGGVKDQLGDINNKLDISSNKFNVTEETIVAALPKFSFVDNDIEITKTAAFKEKITIGEDINEKQHRVEELIENPSVLTYEQDGRIVFFYGQLNSNYQWDKECIVNIYNKDGTLYSICVAQYSNGECLNYKTLLSQGNDEWHYYDRICKQEYNEGISISYLSSYNDIAVLSDIGENDILKTEEFMKVQEKTLIQYYNGNTSDGRYNDSTGNAYHVKYDEDGTVLTLYVGRFVDGTYNDNTGNAWDIAYSKKHDMYVCNTGKFKDGEAVKKSSKKLSQEDIDKIIDGYNFECELNWKVIE